MFKYFYNSSIRKITVGFSTLFNNISVKRYDKNGAVQKTIKVPIAHASKKKWIQKLNQQENVETVLPRMSFQYNIITYDTQRKLNSVGKFYAKSTDSIINTVTVDTGGSGYTDATPPKVVFTGGGTPTVPATAVATVSSGVITAVTVTDGGKGYSSPPAVSFDNTEAGGLETSATATAVLIPISDVMDWIHNPVPVNINFDLNIYVKHNEDALQIIEQIIPYFSPAFNIVINEIPSLGIKRDVNVVFNDISVEDAFEGDLLGDRNVLIYTMIFNAKANLYGPVDKQNKIIKKVIVDTSCDPAGIINLETNTVSVNPLTANIDDTFTTPSVITENY